MFVRLRPDDGILHRPPFTDAEVRYNLIHFICSGENSRCFKSEDGNLIFAQTPGHHAWIWLNERLAAARIRSLLDGLVEYVRELDLPGVTGAPDWIGEVANGYAAARGLTAETRMSLIAYHCPNPVPPRGVQGAFRNATPADKEIVASYLAAFAREAFGVATDAAAQLANAGRMAEQGSLYLWLADDVPVSMACIAHRSARHARINAVYTPPEHRNHGYASALVASLCVMLHREHLTPMLYTDADNPVSNKVYRTIGFVECGRLEEIRFVERPGSIRR